MFNDVIGPVMRGPSSSHTAASVRIGRMVRQLLQNKPAKLVFQFDKAGALATTYESQGSAMGLGAGLLGMDITHPELPDSLQKAKKEGVDINFKIVSFKSDHPNGYKISAESAEGNKMSFYAVSTGGGMFEFRKLNNFSVSLKGDFYESLFEIEHCDEHAIHALIRNIEHSFKDAIAVCDILEASCLFNIKTRTSQFFEIKEAISNSCTIMWDCETEPVLPIQSFKNFDLPFISFKEMVTFCAGKQYTLSELALEYESARAGVSKEEVFTMMKELVVLTKNAINKGLEGTDYDDRILGPQSYLMFEAEKKQKIFPSSINKIIAYTTAIMEVKSSMGIIIAAPTAGSCGVLGGAIFGALERLDADLDAITRAFLAAGLIGIFIAHDYTFAAEEGGCQVECGAASGMAAAGLVELMGGNYIQATSAASMALQNLIGLVCDPVANRVEVPCLGKNILGATNALNTANMSLAGFKEVIPLNEVIETMKKVGCEMPRALCCTGLSGLSVTESSKAISETLKNKSKN